MLGEFDFSDEKLQDTTTNIPAFFPQKIGLKSPPKIGAAKSRPRHDTDAVSIGYRNPMAVLVPLRRKPKLALVVPI